MRKTTKKSKDSASPSGSAALSAGLERLTHGEETVEWHLGARLRNYFLTGLVVVGPVTITIYIAWWFINVMDAWIKPFVDLRTPVAGDLCGHAVTAAAPHDRLQHQRAGQGMRGVGT